jgi:CRISPR/Cas system-associated endonuclease Cas1
MGRTLYLSDSRNAMTVRRDGPSVWIRKNGQAGQRVPLRLVGRVVVIGEVWLDSAAVTLFSEAGVPVLFMNREGDEIAITTGFNMKSPVLSDSQRIFLSTPENRKYFLLWMERTRLAVERITIKRMYRYFDDSIRQGITDADYNEVVEYLKPKDEKKWKVIYNFTFGLFRVVVVEELMRAGLDPHVGILYRHFNYGLALDICRIINSEVEIQTIQYFRSSVIRPNRKEKYARQLLDGNDIRNIVHRFENRREAVRGMISGIIEDLNKMIGRLNHES